MDRNELLAAAERFADRDYADYQGPTGNDTDIRAAISLARHVQRLYDPTPCTSEWAVAVGGAKVGEGIWRIGKVEFWLSSNVPLLIWNSLDWIKNPTRGDVRRLCDALGIELREVEPGPSAST